MKYTIDPTAPEPIMLINGEIGIDIIGADFQSELLQLDAMGKTNIKVYINSLGGSVTDGFSIYSGILKTKARVDTYNVGLCASIAAIIFLAGRKRICADYSTIMIHAASGGDAKTLQAINSGLAIMIQRCGLSQAAVIRLINNGDTFLDAKEALQFGLCTEIEDSADFNRVHGNSIAASLKTGTQRMQKITGIFRGQANAINIMAGIAAKNNQR